MKTDFNNTTIFFQNTQAIHANDIVESNMRNIYKIQLATLSINNDSFTQQQSDTLFSIASQCADKGGPGVFWARALYKTINSDYEFEDDSTCTAQGSLRLASDLSNSFQNSAHLQPNPADDKVILRYSSNNDGYFYITDINGRNLITQKIKKGQAEITIPISFLNNGVYIWYLQSDKTFAKGKLIIAHP